MNVTTTRTPRRRAAGPRARADEPAAARRIERAASGSRSARTRRRLLDAGRTLFAREGLEAVTSHAIAARAGYAAGTFYLHFPDKHALFGELVLEATAELEARLEQVSATARDTASLVRAQAEALVGFAEDRRDLLRLVLRPSGEARELGAGLLERLARGVAERRREAAAAGRARDCFDPDVLAQAIVGLWAQVLAWWAEDPSRARREDLIRTLTHFQLHGSRAEVGSPCHVPSSDCPTGNAPDEGVPSQ